jgi:hypothetical protein
MNRSLRLPEANLTPPNLRHDERVNEIDPRKVRLGMMFMGAVTVIAIVLLIAVDDPVGRFIFGFVAVAGLVQTWRARRHGTSLQ